MNQTEKPIHILVVDDNDTMRQGIAAVLKKAGHQVFEAPCGAEGLDCLRRDAFHLVITDYRMEGMDGISFLKDIRSHAPGTEVMVITAYGTIELAVEAMKAGAWDFITKPFSKETLLLKVERAAEACLQRQNARRLSDENAYLRQEIALHFNFGEIVGESPVMRRVYRTIQKVAASDTSVLIYGESGTGKELVARAIHFTSPRKDRAFIRVNCGALAEGILESELFGHEKGAFTGALRRKKGRFELADGGTLFLDEIGDIPPNLQVKLLRVLQEREFERVGGEETVKVDVRVIAATHRDLPGDVKTGRFREDLYYRLHILPIHLPSLRERKDDIPLLAKHFLERLAGDMGKASPTLSEDALALLKAYDWPGNVRELENVLERTVVLTEGNQIVPENLAITGPDIPGTKIAQNSLDLNTAMDEMEERLIRQALEAAGGVKARAARLLGIKEGALYYKLEKYGLLDKDDNP